MSSNSPVIRGDLVKTQDGYYAIVLFQEADELGVFLCNGMVTVEKPDSVERLLLLGGLGHANFSELLGDRWL